MARLIDPGQYENGEPAWWLGGEAHVGRDSVRGRRTSGWRVMAGELVPLLVSAVIGSLGTFGLKACMSGKSRRVSNERCAETTRDRQVRWTWPVFAEVAEPRHCPACFARPE